jgi:hypothetical protein
MAIRRILEQQLQILPPMAAIPAAANEWYATEVAPDSDADRVWQRGGRSLCKCQRARQQH